MSCLAMQAIRDARCSDQAIRRLPDGAADEERAETVEVERGLLRLAHRLDDGGQREEILADQADDEVVVVAVEAVAGQPDVVRVVGGAERHADRAVLGQDRPLLLLRQLGEAAAAAERIPDRPAPVGVEHRPARPVDQRLLEVRLVAERIGAPEHRVAPASA